MRITVVLFLISPCSWLVGAVGDAITTEISRSELALEKWGSEDSSSFSCLDEDLDKPQLYCCTIAL